MFELYHFMCNKLLYTTNEFILSEFRNIYETYIYSMSLTTQTTQI